MLDIIINIIIGIVNIYFVYLVYQINKKDNNPKIIFISNQYEDPILNNLKNRYGTLDLLNDTLDTFDNEYRVEVQESINNYKSYYYKDLFSRYYCGTRYEKGYWTIDYNQKGFPEEKENKIIIWYLDVENKSEYPATNLQIKLELIIKKHDWDTGIDEADILNERIVEYERIKRTIMLDYFPGLYKKRYKLLNLNGDFPKADLIITKAKSDEATYISKPIKIDSYEHSSFNTGFEDSQNYRRFLGADKAK